MCLHNILSKFHTYILLLEFSLIQVLAIIFPNMKFDINIDDFHRNIYK